MDRFAYVIRGKVTAAGERIFLIADAHMGAAGAEEEQLKEQRLLSFLQQLPVEASRLIICGDLFDFWFEYRHAVPRRHFPVLAQLSHLTRAGLRIDYLAGNHDFWLGSFLEKEIGITLHRDDLVINSDGQKIYLRHGDGLLRHDHLYRLLKRVLRFPLNIYLYRLIHPDVGIPLALFFSRWSRAAAKNRPDYRDDDYRAYARQKLCEGYAGVVLGHSHIAALDRFPQGWYLNPGDWMRLFTFAILTGGQPALYQWDGHASHPFDPPMRKEASGE